MLAYNLSLWTLFPIKTVIRQKLMLLSNLLRRLHLKVFVFLGIVSSALINVYSIIYVGLGTLSSPSIANSVSLLPGHGHSMASRFANSMLSKQRRQADASKIIDPLKLRIQGGPTFLLGIPTIQDEVERRQAVRETYLSFFKDLYHEDQPNRVCSLAQIQRNISLFLECQVVYFFFLGGNPNGPTELVAPNSSFPMTIEGNLDEDDLIYFNIRENLEDGKSQTFFKYASMLSKEIQFDYVGKIDSDTLLFLPAFLDFAAIHLPPRQLLVYGGNPHDRNACDTNSHDSHTCPLELVGQLYMGGSFYWMSPDLAEFVTSNAVPRSKLTVRHEDIDIGNFVFTYPNVYEGKNIRVVNVTGSQLLIHQLVDGNWMFRNRATSLSGMLWAHSLNDGQYPGPFFKDLRHFRKVWRQFQWYWLSNKTLVTDDIFQLHDLPHTPDKPLVHSNDYIFSKQDFDSSPIVLERHKLILFPISGVGDSDWRRLIRRIMGFSDWKEDERQFDGLVYLSDFNHTQASELMTRHDYTRAIFVREPKLRLLSTYLERVQPDRGESFRDLCCQGLRRCMRTEDISFDFFVETIRDCDEPFWRPQIYRMEPKYWKFVNFVGHYQSIRHDTERLLTKLGLWDLFGKTGWGGKTGEGDAIFTNISYIHNETLVRNYLTPLAEKMAQKFSKSDYDAKEILQFSRNLQLEPATQSSLIQR